MNKRNIIITILSVLILVCIFAFARTTTTDLGLVKPTWEEESPEYDILVDFNANMDILEALANDPLEFDTGERLEDRAGAMWTGNTETGITATYQDADNTIDLVIGADDIVQTMLKCVNEPTDEDIFTYEDTTGDFEWHTLAELSIQSLDATLTALAGLTISANSLIYGTGADAFSVLACNATATNKFLRQVSSGAPAWETIADGDVPNDITIDLATLATTFTATDNESEALACLMVFVDGATGAQGGETDGDLTYNPNTGTLTVPALDLTTPLPDSEVANNITIDLATLATIITVTDNESTAENNPICFVAGADPDGGSLGIETDGDFHYNPSTGTVTATVFSGTAGYTNLTSFVDQTAWRVFYSDTDGDITELALGADGTFLGSNGAAAAPTFSVPAGGGDVVKVGTPANSQIGVWTGDGTIEGAATLTYDGSVLVVDGDITIGANYVGRDVDNTIDFATDNHIIFKTNGATGMEVDSTGELDMNANTIGFTQQSTTGDGTTTIDWKLGNKFKFTFGAQNDTFTFTAPTNPCNILLMLIQDGTGSRTVTWPGTVKWAGGTVPTLTTTAAGIDICSFYWDGTNYFGVASLAFATP